MNNGFIPINGQTIKAIREQAGLTIAELARKCRVTEQTIKNIEDSKYNSVRPGTYVRLKRFLNVGKFELQKEFKLADVIDIRSKQYEEVL